VTVTRRWTGEVALWLVVRTVVLFELALPDGRYISGDAGLFAGWGRTLASGAALSTDAWQYPPGFALLIAGIAALGGGATALLALNLACDLLILRLVRGTPGALLWALAPLAMGLMMLTHLDTVVAALAVVGLSRAPGWGRGLALGLGASLKLWPAALAGASRPRAAVRTAVAAALAYGATAVLARVLLGAESFTQNLAGRGLQVESLAAWPFMLARALGVDVPLDFRSGANEIALPLADDVARLLLPLSAVAVAGLWIWGWSSGASARGRGLPMSLLLLVTLLLTSRVLSPQFSVWILALLALLVAHVRTPRPVVAAGFATAVLGHVLYPFAYDDFLAGGWPGLTIQTLRLAALLGLAIALVRSVLPPHAAYDSAPRHAVPAAAPERSSVTGTGLAMAAGTPPARAAVPPPAPAPATATATATATARDARP